VPHSLSDGIRSLKQGWLLAGRAVYKEWREKAASPKSMATGVMFFNGDQQLKPTWAANIPSALSFGVCKAVSPVEVLIPPHVSLDFTAPCNICLD
jgi:hypothetical protein